MNRFICRSPKTETVPGKREGVVSDGTSQTPKPGAAQTDTLFSAHLGRWRLTVGRVTERERWGSRGPAQSCRLQTHVVFRVLRCGFVRDRGAAPDGSANGCLKATSTQAVTGRKDENIPVEKRRVRAQTQSLIRLPPLWVRAAADLGARRCRADYAPQHARPAYVRILQAPGRTDSTGEHYDRRLRVTRRKILPVARRTSPRRQASSRTTFSRRSGKRRPPPHRERPARQGPHSSDWYNLSTQTTRN